MLAFQSLGFGQRVYRTSLGVVAYYTPIAPPWRSLEALESPGSLASSDLPPLLFLHSLGGGSSAYEWSKVYPAFAPDYQVIAPDLIGWGQSTHPAKDYRVEDYLTLLTELLEQIGQPVPVIASSLTAGIVIRLAIQRPDLFNFLFLVSPAGYSDFGADYGQGIAAKLAGIPGLDRLIYRLGAANEIAVKTFLEQVLFAERSRLIPETVEAYLASATQRHADYAALASLRGDLCFDLALYLDQLRVPTFLAWGEKSRFGDSSVGQRLVKLNPAVIQAFWAIENVGVMPQLETPEVVIGLLCAALAQAKSGIQNGEPKR
jgi:pimeloyl-ACP methyl ester carboxylesterase